MAAERNSQAEVCLCSIAVAPAIQALQLPPKKEVGQGHQLGTHSGPMSGQGNDDAELPACLLISVRL